MNTKYTPSSIEPKLYKSWEDQKIFQATSKSQKEPYSVVIPPPNVTGILHMGHVLNNTIQDVLVRRARMHGKEVCWVPGTDHASIATEARVVAMLKERGIEKSSLTREEFLQYAWEWKEKYGGIILEQLEKLGCSCDWTRTTFTMDEHMNDAVKKTFITLHEKTLIYRGSRMIYWDPLGRTALSDDEVIYQSGRTDLVYIKYLIKGESQAITVATTRPETVFGDVAICVNPKDERYRWLAGKLAIVPLCGREIPIIFDEYVDMSFGTGCLKVTPAHDMNDHELAVKHGLPCINILNDDGSLNQNANEYCGQDRFLARGNVLEELKVLDLIEKTEQITHNVGHSERTNTVVEPRLSTQWFLKMKEISQPALENVLNGNIKFHPAKFQNMYKAWLENVKDWCISRQLWWGHRIPAYYLEDGTCIVAEDVDEALNKAKLFTKNENLRIEDLHQDPDVLDTWFSAWLWPLEVFHGLTDVGNRDFKYFYPTNDLVTAPEIIFFWVARMIIAGYLFTGVAPFRNVYFTGIVRDKQRRKMSKSLGNSPDPIDLIEKYGADGVRVGMLLCAPAGNDLLFDEKLCEQGRNFANKLWNASLLIGKWRVDDSLPAQHEIAIKWFANRLQSCLTEIDRCFDEYRLSEALMIIYKLVWDDFCSNYLEMVKSSDGKLDVGTHVATLDFLEKILKLVHPFMPFISEELWQNFLFLEKESTPRSIMYESWPKRAEIDREVLDSANKTFELIAGIRNAKISSKLPMKEAINICLDADEMPVWVNLFLPYIKKLACVGDILLAERSENDCRESTDIGVKGYSFFFNQESKVESLQDGEKRQAELEHCKGFLQTIEAKLKNQKFLEHASAELVAREKQKHADTLARIKSLEKSF